jgi:hypothetical protein
LSRAAPAEIQRKKIEMGFKMLCGMLLFSIDKIMGSGEITLLIEAVPKLQFLEQLP